MSADTGWPERRRVPSQKHNGKRLYDLLGDVILREALKGKPQLIRELLDRVEGPVAPAAASGPPVQTLVMNIVPAKPPPADGPSLRVTHVIGPEVEGG
jgi:hypothetical protein